MSSTNPISVGYSSIWTALNGWPAFAALVKPGLQTQQNLQTPGYQPSNNAQAGDRPSCRLVEGRMQGMPYSRNSKAVQIDAAYPLEIRSGSMLVDKVNLLETVVTQALMNSDGSRPGSLGTGIINKWVLDPTDLRQRDTQTKIPEWVCALTIRITFMIMRSDFLSTTYT